MIQLIAGLERPGRAKRAGKRRVRRRMITAMMRVKTVNKKLKRMGRRNLPETPGGPLGKLTPRRNKKSRNQAQRNRIGPLVRKTRLEFFST